MKVLGVGCLWLDYTDDAGVEGETKNGTQIFHDFKVALESIPSVSNVAFNPSWADQDDWAEAEVTHGLKPNRIVPSFINNWISFDIYIPERVQEQISDGVSCSSENFHVDLYFDYYMPVTYITFDVGDDDYVNPSSAVVIVRKLLEKHLSSKVLSGCVGPSPFHCNFTLKVDSSHNGGPRLDDTSDSALGYRDITITLSSLDEPIPLVLSELGRIFSAFYHLSVLRSGLIRRTTKVMALASSLLQPSTSKGVKRFRSLIAEGDVITEIKREVTLGRLQQLELDKFLLEIDRDNGTGEGTPLGRYFAEYRELSKTNAWSDIDYLTTFSEERRQKLFANLSSVISGVLGGVIGALLASTLTYFLTVAPRNENVVPSVQTTHKKLDIGVTPPPVQRGLPTTTLNTAP